MEKTYQDTLDGKLLIAVRWCATSNMANCTLESEEDRDVVGHGKTAVDAGLWVCRYGEGRHVVPNSAIVEVIPEPIVSSVIRVDFEL